MNNFISLIIGIGIGCLITVIGLNKHSHIIAEEKPGITLLEYWDGKK